MRLATHSSVAAEASTSSSCRLGRNEFRPGSGVVARLGTQQRQQRSSSSCSRPIRDSSKRRVVVASALPSDKQDKKGFHITRLAATEAPASLPPLKVELREAEEDAELRAVAALRAVSFYAYPPEREFAGKVMVGAALRAVLHQAMKEEEEFALLKQQRMERRLAASHAANVAAATVGADNGNGSGSGSGSADEGPAERNAALMAVASESDIGAACDARYVLQGTGQVVAGTLDVYAVRAMPGEKLIGNAKNPAYLANVCVAPEARRRDVGSALLAAARETARSWGVDALYVHILAVNEGARRFYEGAGFEVEKEESSNEAHYRGRCLDGVEGAGRTLLLRDSRL